MVDLHAIAELHGVDETDADAAVELEGVCGPAHLASAASSRCPQRQRRVAFLPLGPITLRSLKVALYVEDPTV
jgi:hypothetical protein